MSELDRRARASTRLTALRANVARGQNLVDERLVDEFHLALDDLQASGIDVADFRIKPSGLKRRITHFSTLSFPNSPAGPRYSSEKYVDRAFFCARLDAVQHALAVVATGLEGESSSSRRQSAGTACAKRREMTMSNEQGLDERIWQDIERDYGIGKRSFGKRINFVIDNYKRKVIFRDVEHAYQLAQDGFAKPAVILSGGIIEELLRLYLESKQVQHKGDSLNDYIETCERNKLIKPGVLRLSDSVRQFRNLVHLKKEETARHAISKATAKGAVSSIFTLANDF